MNGRCGQVMVGSGPDTYDPVCELLAGHAGWCMSTAAIGQHRLDQAPALPKNQHGWVPNTTEPAEGEGPWGDMDGERYWCVADSASEAMAAFDGIDCDPGYYGVQLTLERCKIRRVAWDDQHEEADIEECKAPNDDGAVEGWRLTVTGL